MCLSNMESSSMIMEELLHITDLQKAFIVAGYCIIPNEGATLLNHRTDGVDINDEIEKN